MPDRGVRPLAAGLELEDKRQNLVIAIGPRIDTLHSKSLFKVLIDNQGGHRLALSRRRVYFPILSLAGPGGNETSTTPEDRTNCRSPPRGANDVCHHFGG